MPLVECAACGRRWRVVGRRERMRCSCGAVLDPETMRVKPVAAEAESSLTPEELRERDLAAVRTLRDAHQRILAEIKKVIVGQERVVDELLIALFSRGHALLVGVPGLAKTLMVSTLANCLNLRFHRIQFTPDLMPADITGTEVLQDDPETGQRRFKFLKGPIFANLILADEINRTPPKTQAALLEAMQELQVTVGGQRYASVVWPGDLCSDFREFGNTDDDGTVHVGGLPSAVRAGTGLAVSGYPFFASDTGGFRHDRPTAEVMIRWTEYAALLPIMQYGGGGENVKHGDLDYGLVHADRNYDVHMGSDMTCVDCHTSEAHKIKGESTAINTAADDNRILCTDCHDMPIHKSKILNNHTEKIACQTCHIPVYAKGKPTKIWWDWSTAGKDSTAPKDKYGLPTFMKKKGSFAWGKNLKPELRWYNGTLERYLTGDKLNPKKVLSLNKPLGNVNDKNSKLFPFKVMRGKQIYDSKYNYLIIPHLWGGFWKDFDWNKAAEVGMKAAGLAYSGKYDFVETEMYWKVNHMVSPKDQTLKCSNCHGKGKNKLIDWKALGYKGDQMYAKYRQ